MPAVIRGQNGKMCLGIVCLDLSSSGEHWGTTFFTPYGILEQGNQMSAVEQKFIRQFSPYSYWYSPEIEGDIHVDFDETPDDVAGILVTNVASDSYTLDWNQKTITICYAQIRCFGW